MPAIGTNIFMGVEVRAPGLMGRVFRKRDKPAMEKFARENLSELGR